MCLFLVGYLFIYGSFFVWFAINVNFHVYIIIILMRDEKEERIKRGQTNKAKQHSTPKAVTFSKKNELPRVGLYI